MLQVHFVLTSLCAVAAAAAIIFSTANASPSSSTSTNTTTSVTNQQRGSDIKKVRQNNNYDTTTFDATSSTVTTTTVTAPSPVPTQTSWAGINSYYLWSCNATVRADALNAVRAAGLRVIRVFLLSTQGKGAIGACSDTQVPDVEPNSVGVYNDTILSRLDDLMYEASARGIKLTVALHDRWSLGCWRDDAYQRKYNITPVPDCGKQSARNDPMSFYRNVSARADFVRRIEHILNFQSRHTHAPLGQWSQALFSIEAENEAFGHVALTTKATATAAAAWLCNMSAVIRRNVAPNVLVSTGGGGIGAVPTGGSSIEYERAAALAACPDIDILAMHSYASSAGIDTLLAGYTKALVRTHTLHSNTRLILQEWGATGANSTVQSSSITSIAATAARYGVPQFFWQLQPAHAPLSSTQLAVSPPAPAPSPGRQRSRNADGRTWTSYCTDVSCPTEAWVTGIYPAAQAAALQQQQQRHSQTRTHVLDNTEKVKRENKTETKGEEALLLGTDSSGGAVGGDNLYYDAAMSTTTDNFNVADWPEIWGCVRDSDCRYNGICQDGKCICHPGWRGPTCAALRLGRTPRNNGYRLSDNTSSWGGSVMRGQDGQYHMFASQITEHCGLNAWSTNSQIVRATAQSPLGPYTFREVVAERFAHEPNLVYGTAPGTVILLGTMYPQPPAHYANCTQEDKHEDSLVAAIPPPAAASPRPEYIILESHSGDIRQHQVKTTHSSANTRAPTAPPPSPLHPARNTYIWEASSPAGIARVQRRLAISAPKWDWDPQHNNAVCDTNAAAIAVSALHRTPPPLSGGSGGDSIRRRRELTNASRWPKPSNRQESSKNQVAPEVGGLVGIWRRCETANLHTIPHTFSAAAAAAAFSPVKSSSSTSSNRETDPDNGLNSSSAITTIKVPFLPNISVNFPFMSHAGAEDPMVWTRGDGILHAILHDEQLTRCADAPVGCWPGGRHAFSEDEGATWNYSPYDAYNGTVLYDDNSSDNLYLRARPHMILDEHGKPIALSSGARPRKDSDYVYTLVQPVESGT